MKYLLLIITTLSLSCNTSEKEEVVLVEDMYNPVGLNSEEPTFFQTQYGTGLTWLEKNGEEVEFKYAEYKNSNWTDPQTIVSNDMVLANWADFPGIAVNGSNWVAWYLQISSTETFAYDVMIKQSDDEGASWSAPFKLHNDTTITEHGFVSAVAADNGFQLIWLDGRNATEMTGNFTIRTAFLDIEGVVSGRKILDDNTCTCCQTSLVNTGKDDFIALYRDRSEKEIRDIATVSFSKVDSETLPEVLFEDSWHIEGCPVNGPRAISTEDKTGVAWFTMGTDNISKIKLMISEDKGKSYSPPLVVDTDNLGRVDILSTGETFYISYIDNVEKGAAIKIAEIENNKILNIHTIAKVSPSRKTGFPRIAFSQDESGIFITYTEVESNSVEVKYLAIN